VYRSAIPIPTLLLFKILLQLLRNLLRLLFPTSRNDLIEFTDSGIGDVAHSCYWNEFGGVYISAVIQDVISDMNLSVQRERRSGRG